MDRVDSIWSAMNLKYCGNSWSHWKPICPIQMAYETQKSHEIHTIIVISQMTIDKWHTKRESCRNRVRWSVTRADVWASRALISPLPWRHSERVCHYYNWSMHEAQRERKGTLIRWKAGKGYRRSNTLIFNWYCKRFVTNFRSLRIRETTFFDREVLCFTDSTYSREKGWRKSKFCLESRNKLIIWPPHGLFCFTDSTYSSDKCWRQWDCGLGSRTNWYPPEFSCFTDST